jgi:hypothetical protein
MDKTIIYYSSNSEDPKFEAKIQANLPDLPIISVTQKPCTLGKNICVGERGNSYINEYRQILLALKEVKTPYFISCEADFLYPQDYFEFEPTGENIYRSDNVWIVKDRFYKKPYSEGSQIAKTDYMISFIEHYLDGLPEWFGTRPLPTDRFFKTYQQHQKELWRLPFTFFHTDPCLSFKTGNGVMMATKTSGEKVDNLPIWGNIKELKEKYL